MRVSLLIALFASLSAAFLACTSDGTVTPPDDTAPTNESDGGDEVPNPESKDASRDATPDAVSASCFVDPTPYVQAWKPPRQMHACEKNALDTFATVCSGSPTSTPCQEFRSANPECAACLFGSASDAKWGLFVADADAPGAVDGYRYNHGGCVQLETGNVTCGKVYQADKECPHVACDTCSESELSSCTSKAFKSSTSCAQHSTATVLFCSRLGFIDDHCGTLLEAARTFCG